MRLRESGGGQPRGHGRPGDLVPTCRRRSGRPQGGAGAERGRGQRGRRQRERLRAGAMSAEPICSALPAVPSQKLADLRFLSRGASGTVSSARHADWRVQVAVKHLHIHTPLLDR